MYQDNNYTFFAILSRKAEVGRQANALGHLATGLHQLQDSSSTLHLEEYRDSEGDQLAAISRFPFVVLSAKNSNQIRMVRLSLEELGVPCNTFVSQMVAGSSLEQREQTATTNKNDLDYIGLVTFGPKDKLDPLFRKFSLYHGQSSPADVNDE